MAATSAMSQYAVNRAPAIRFTQSACTRPRPPHPIKPRLSESNIVSDSRLQAFNKEFHRPAGCGDMALRVRNVLDPIGLSQLVIMHARSGKLLARSLDIHRAIMQ